MSTADTIRLKERERCARIARDHIHTLAEWNISYWDKNRDQRHYWNQACNGIEIAIKAKEGE